MPVFAQFNLLGGVLLAVLGLMIVFMLLRTHRYLSRQRGDQSAIVETPRPAREDREHHLDAPPEVLRWEVQMHETARELSGQLDSKMGALQVLIAEADRASSRLEAALADSSAVAGQQDEETAKPDSTGEAEASALSAETAPPEPNREQIYTLADYGYTAAEIARRTGNPIAEVELILALRKR